MKPQVKKRQMMNRLATCALLASALGAGASLGQGIPDRPEKLSYPPLSYEVPRAKDARVMLKNGVPAYLVADPKGVPLVRISVFWRGGGYMEPAGKAGVSGLFGTQLVQGGTKAVDAARLEDRLEALAATLTSSCGETQGHVALQVRSKDVKEGLDLLMQALTEPAFDKERLDLARKAARQALERRNDSVTSIAQYQRAFLLYGDHFFMSPDATSQSLEGITREDLAAFHARILHPANLVVAVSGQFDRKAMAALLDGTVGRIAPAPGAGPSPKVPVPDFRRTPGLYLTDKDAPQAMVEWTIPGIRRSDPDWHAAMVMNHILGGSFTGRLMKRIRSDEGLTYGVRTALGEGPHWQGDLSGSMQTKNRSVAYSLRIAVEEMKRLKDEPLTKAELKAVQDGLVESFPSQWASRQATAARFAEERLNGWPEDWWADFRAKVQAVTPADVQRMARRILDLDRMVVLAVGKASEIETGDVDHPGAFRDVAKLPFVRLPLRDPGSLKPLAP
jgi:predicted Zn-dependent peptidase